MATLFPPGYGGYPSYQFSSPNQYSSRYYNDRYGRREMAFAPHYPTQQPLYQPPFNPAGAYSSNRYDKAGLFGFGNQLIGALNELDDRYRQEQYYNRLSKLERQYQRLHGTAMPLPYQSAPQYEYVKETQIVPFPILMNPGAASYGTQTIIGNNNPWNMGYNNNTTMNFGAGFGGDLPPKIRVIFIPTGQSLSQQPCTGPLAMPPFLYNRISQPLSSFPLPPPLPQLGSMPLTPAVQQMVLQRYSNPIAVLPYSSNWQQPQLMRPNFSQGFQQQLQQPMVPMQPYLPAPQSYMPPAMPAYPSYPAASQQYNSFPAPVPFQGFPSQAPAPQPYASYPAPAPVQCFPSQPPAPQPYVPYPPPAPVQNFSALQPAPASVPIQGFPLLPPAPQPYIPAPAYTQGYSSLPPAPQPYAPPSSFTVPYNNQCIPQSPLSQFSSVSDPSSTSYPSLCRACPPAPPPLTISVSGHCWVQHCSACHHVPTHDTNHNVRPNTGRSTPLLRHPTVPQYVPDQTPYQPPYPQQQQQQQQCMLPNAPGMMRPWLRKTPPLPPGSVVLSDKCFNRDGSCCWDYSHSQKQHRPHRQHRERRQHREHKRGSQSKRRSTTISSRSGSSDEPTALKASKSVSPRRASKNSKNSSQEKAPVILKNPESRSSSSGLSTEYDKTAMYVPPEKKEPVPEQLAGEARNVNLQYNYQPQELPSVYHTNRYLKSSSETSTISLSGRASSELSFSYVKQGSRTVTVINDLNSINEESFNHKKQEKPPLPPSYTRKLKDKLYIIRELSAASPSTFSTYSSDAPFDIIDKDIDSISLSSTIEGNKLEGDANLHHQMF
ncbi:unnamed protein product [Adineta steineri]|uniref:Uncharacterized protein n=1 Tax=Adineta steineri TaxID=433720 RepID=A0A813U068_9BILA|nr:unnamed protein product [Adineta steineri]CAF1583803.1 unnamed protein product [Adineta steineri]